MESTLTDPAAALPAAVASVPSRHSLVEAGSPSDGPVIEEAPPSLTEEALPPELLADLEDANLVLSPGYIGSDRRGQGLRARVLRATFAQRRSLLRLELLVVAVVAVLVVASVVLVGPVAHGSSALASGTGTKRTPVHHRAPIAAAVPAPTPAVSPAPTATSPAPTATSPVPTVSATPVAPPPAASAATPAAPPPAAAAYLTPAELGAQALTLVTYPWQKIPGYSIQFLPISEAPTPGFYGNTTFTMGQAGGQSVLYVYPGETVQRLAAITAFEIGHEVDAAGVYPADGDTGHAQIEKLLNYFPASWMPNCDCAEQSFLSGWYAAAFSNQWSPGVGNWSQILPEPSGATLAAMQPWLNPTIP
ncbi:MAG TPA: hypothetical protein VGY51_03475 [Acidimicrobiales bacterium]|nr:hypothetical protein [Acidimicrobiales bacterium]